MTMNASRRRPFTTLSTLMLLAITIALSGKMIVSPFAEKQQHQRRIEEDAVKEKSDSQDAVSPQRPIMYTFFQQRENEDGVLLEHETQETQDQISVWSELWTKAGWDTKVLTIEDAEKHPDFEKYSAEILKESPRMFYGALYKNSYNYMCFMRWLAMAAQGKGGWMSDYDAIPIGITIDMGTNLPNDGDFTCYDRHVPSLLSGSAEEWDRMSNLILEEGVANIKKDDVELYSDMFALRDIHIKSHTAYIQESKIHSGFPYQVINEVDCSRLNGMYADHVSHSNSKEALAEGLIESPNNQYENRLRPGWARDLDENWRTQCSVD